LNGYKNLQKMIQNNILRSRLLLLLLLIALGSAAQKNTDFFHISGRIRVDNGEPTGTVVTLTNAASNSVENSATLNSTGKFEFDLKYFSEYKLSVVRENHYTKEIDVSTMIPSNVWAKDSIFPPFLMVVTIYKKVPDVAMSFEGKTVGKICYSPKGKLDNFDSNIFIDDKDIRKEIDQAMKAHEDELFNKKMAEAIDFEKKNQIREAIKAYEEALAIRKNDQFIKPKLKELASDLKNLEKDASIEAEFSRLLATGDDQVTKLKYPEAVDSYKRALALKPGDKVASDKLANAEQLLAKLNADKAKQDAEFARLLAEGDESVKNQKYTEAIDSFKGALVIKTGDKIATEKLNNAEQLLAKFNADKTKQEAEFARLLAAGDESVKNQKYPEAISNFKSALVIKTGDKTATEKLINAEQLLAKLNADKAKQDAEFARLLAAGDESVKNQKYTEAIDSFKGALVIKTGDKIATEKLNNAEQLLAKFNADKAKQEAEFARLLAAGDESVKNQKYPEAISNFKSALVIKTGDKTATEKLINAEQLLAKLNADKAKQDAEFTRLLAAGDESVKNQKYPEAIDSFKGALKIRTGDKTASDKLAIAEQLLTKFNADKAKQDAEFARLLAAGDESVKNQKYPDAISNFKGALAIRTGDKVASDKLANAEQLLAKLNADKAKQDAEFARLLAAGDESVKNQKYPDAIDSFKGALVIRTGDKVATEKLTNAQQLLAKFNADKAKQDAEFARLLAAGDESVKNQKYPEAIDSFKGALAIKTGDKVASDKLANAEQLLAKLNADKAKQDAEFTRLLAAGDESVKNQKYPEAIDSFKGALVIRTGDKVATEKLTNAQQLLAKFNADKAKQEAEFARLLAAGDENVKNQKYSEAIDSFKGALTIKTGDKVASDKLANAEQLLAKLNADKAKQDAEFARLLAAGDESVKNQKYPEAIDSFKGALKIRTGDKTASDKLAIAEQLLAKFNADKAKQDAEFARLLAAGDESVKNQKYPEAIESFKGALVIKTGDKVATDKLANAEQLLAKLNADKAKQDAEFARLLAAGDESVKNQKYPDAIDSFKGALVIKTGDKIATDKLANARQLLANQIADKQRMEAENQRKLQGEDSYQKNIQTADANFSKSMWTVAIFYYQEALKFKTLDKYALERVDNCKKMIDGNITAERMVQYNTYIKRGDDDLQARQYSSSRFYYGKAGEILPWENYPKEQLKIVEKLISSTDVSGADAQYFDAVKKADDAVLQKNYAIARFYFQKAISFKPEEEYPKQQLKRLTSDL
jgi:tetratricopeptide (TPR) repeat protein